MRVSQRLSVPLDVFGHRVSTLEEAAYEVRQYVISQDCSDEEQGRRLVRKLRDVKSADEAFDAEGELRCWLRTQHRTNRALH